MVQSTTIMSNTSPHSIGTSDGDLLQELAWEGKIK